ncbi:MAG: hypothetical protein JXR95_10800 [Deltaproteobacteria bacterium]|nr:hypothetical protein [Deltaproteobacteria bacterium]
MSWNLFVTLTSFTLWMAIVTGSGLSWYDFSPFIVFPWLVIDLKFNHFVRIFLWPFSIAMLLITRPESGNLKLITVLVLWVVYYLAVLNYEDTLSNSSSSMVPVTSDNILPEVFPVIHTLIFLIIYLIFGRQNILLLSLSAYVSCGQFVWWTKITEGSKHARNVSIVMTSVSSVMFAGLLILYNHGIYTALFYGIFVATGALSLLGPYAADSLKSS